MTKVFLTAVFFSLSSISLAQNFTRITDATNPIFAKILVQGYVGASWIDYNNDGWLDLFVSKSFLYKNLKNGQFEALDAINIKNQGQTFGNTWADYDNDGDLDVFVAGAKNSKGSALYRNEGNDKFSKIRTGAIGDTLNNAGWGTCFGDYDNDGNVDLMIAAAFGFGGVTHNNRLLHNNGDGTFSRADTTTISSVSAPYTVPSWSDYDLDGDLDLFIGSGPATGVLAPDFLFQNHLKEKNKAFFTRILSNPIGTDLLDGQVWNWIDYDNDGDLDGFITNYNYPTPNNLYRNDNGTFVKMTAAQVGTIVSDKGLFLSNTWGDFDNDGDLDCLTSRDNGQGSAPGNCIYYVNNGDGTFSSQPNSVLFTQTNFASCVTYGDYDRDGDLDIYATSGNKSFGGLFKNDLANGNAWVNFHCTGVASNRAAIGTKIRLTAKINGKTTTQIREISAQNTFNGHNMLNVHFGLGDAEVIDNLEIMWSSGEKTSCQNIAVDKFYEIKEGECPKISTVATSNVSEKKSELLLYPNPIREHLGATFQAPETGEYQISVCNEIGQKIQSFTRFFNENAKENINFDAKSWQNGVYFLTIEKGSWKLTEKIIKQ